MSVAIRTATRVQDQDDVNVTVGAGVDEYALCWDNDTAKFVLRQMTSGVTDHGALTGLSDDDHSQYLLATGARVGATSQAQAFRLADAVTNAVTNVVTIGHNTSGTAAAGFGGGLAFNLQSSTTASQSAAAIKAVWTDATHATRTSALQFQTVNSAAALATAMTILGDGKVGIGTSAPAKALEIGGPQYHSAIRVMQTGGTTPSYFGQLFTNVTFVSHNLTFDGAGWNRDNTAAVGVLYDMGGADPFRLRITPTGSNPATLTTVMTASTAAVYFALPVGIGATSPATLLHTLLTSAATNAVTNVVTIGHNTSGTAAAGFGAGQLFALESSTTAAQSAARIQALWYEATHATRKADLVLTAYDTAGREGLRIRGAGSAPALGFYGVSPIERATLATGAGASVDDVISALQNLGLVKQS